MMDQLPQAAEITALNQFNLSHIPGLMPALERAESLKITSPESANEAGEVKKVFIGARKMIMDRFDPTTSVLFSLHRMFTTRRKSLLTEIEHPEIVIDEKLIQWDVQQRLAASAAAEAAEVERQAQQAEADALAEMDPTVTRTTVVVAPVEVASAKVEGIAMIDYYSAEVHDTVALCRAIADGKIPADYVVPNFPKLNDRAKAMRGEFNVPGCKLVVTRKPKGTR
jgi:hypothetical protein